MKRLILVIAISLIGCGDDSPMVKIMDPSGAVQNNSNGTPGFVNRFVTPGFNTPGGNTPTDPGPGPNPNNGPAPTGGGNQVTLPKTRPMAPPMPSLTRNQEKQLNLGKKAMMKRVYSRIANYSNKNWAKSYIPYPTNDYNTCLTKSDAAKKGLPTFRTDNKPPIGNPAWIGGPYSCQSPKYQGQETCYRVSAIAVPNTAPQDRIIQSGVAAGKMELRFDEADVPFPGQDPRKGSSLGRYASLWSNPSARRLPEQNFDNVEFKPYISGVPVAEPNLHHGPGNMLRRCKSYLDAVDVKFYQFAKEEAATQDKSTGATLRSQGVNYDFNKWVDVIVFDYTEAYRRKRAIGILQSYQQSLKGPLQEDLEWADQGEAEFYREYKNKAACNKRWNDKVRSINHSLRSPLFLQNPCN